MGGLPRPGPREQIRGEVGKGGEAPLRQDSSILLPLPGVTGSCLPRMPQETV